MDHDSTRIPGEPTTKVGQVLAELRRQIISGAYKPGDRFPTFKEMGEQFQVSRAVLQLAVQQLRKDGFVRTVSRQGMYVSRTPPHLTRYALILPGDEHRKGYSTMVKALLDAAESSSQQDPTQQFVLYRRAMDPDDSGAVRQKLIEDIRMQRLVGLIFTPGTQPVLESLPEAEAMSLPRVFLGESPNYGVKPTVGAELDMFYRRALECLAAQGRRRVAIIHMARTCEDLDHAALFSEAGLDYHEPWIQEIGRSNPETIERLLQLLFDPRVPIRPDGLVIADDNLVEHATAGLMRVGLRVGQDLDAIAYAHWPWRQPSALPIRRLGFDIGEILRRSVEVVQNIRAGVAVPAHQMIPASFEDELKLEDRTVVPLDAEPGSILSSGRIQTANPAG